ncbi:MAG: prolyl oligopeptidase family serine peptidase [Anaerolineaceae bacterium]|nr:prolyl oligopeptidase family serine peptidase [Anaerolineaceae bacterium]
MKNKKPVVAESLFDIVQVEDPQISPDGKTVAFVHMQPMAASDDYKRSIWFAPLDGEKEPQRFVHSGKADFSPRWSPDGCSLIFVSTRSGKPQVYEIPLNGGEAVQRTNMPGGVSSPEWSPDGKWIAFLSEATKDEREMEDAGIAFDVALQNSVANWSKESRRSKKDPRVIEKLPYKTGTSFFDGCYRHIYVMPSKGGKSRRLSDGDFHHSAVSWTPDSREVLTNSNREQSSGDEFFELWSSIIAFNVQSGEERVVAFEVSEEGRGPEVSPDGKWVAHCFVPKVPSPYQEPYYIGVTPMTGGDTRIVSGDDLTVADFKWDLDSQHLLFISHDNGEGKLVRKTLDGQKEETLLDGPRMLTEFDVSPLNKICYTVSSPLKPSELFVVSRDNLNKEKALTAFNQDWESSHFLSIPKEIRYKGAGDVEVQGWYMRPMDFDPEKSYPLAVEIHGGPQVMWGNSFWHEFQMLTSRGYFVFFCNPRGSSGYGIEFQRIRGNGGYTDMPDIMTGADQVLALEPAADADRMVVTGGSYGGFLTGWIVTHTERFKAAVSQRGVYDEFNMFGSGDIPESVEWYFNGVPRPETMMEVWDHSPAAHAANVTTPLMILHSELDFRVPISQAETFFAYLRRQGNRNAVMVRYPDEGHELSRSGHPLHRVDRLYKIMSWFDQHVQPALLSPVALDTNQIKTSLEELGGWAFVDNHLRYDKPCGNFTMSMDFANHIANYAKRCNIDPVLVISADQVKVQLQNAAANGVTKDEIEFARRLNIDILMED